jgi:hypothetical protein
MRVIVERQTNARDATDARRGVDGGETGGGIRDDQTVRVRESGGCPARATRESARERERERRIALRCVHVRVTDHGV